MDRSIIGLSGLRPRTSLHILFATNIILSFFGWLRDDYDMVRLALGVAHLIVGVLFALSFLFWFPGTIGARRPLGPRIAYWAAFLSFPLSYLLIAQILLLLSLLVCLGAYLALFLYLRRFHEKHGGTLEFHRYVEVPVFALVIWTGVVTRMDPGGPFIFAYFSHVLFVVLAAAGGIVACIRALRVSLVTESIRGFVPRVMGSRVLWSFVLVPMGVAVVAWAAGARWAQKFGEESTTGLYRNLTVPIEDAADVLGGVAYPARVVARRWCDSESCHKSIYDQWNISAHRFSVNNIAYQKVREEFGDEFGSGAEVFCDRCHSPIGIMVGEPAGPLAMREGINCAICHGIAGSEKSNGLVTYRFRNRYSYPTRNIEEAERYYRMLVRLTPWQHSRQWEQLDDERTCFPCHRVELPPRYAARDGIVLGDMHGPWYKSNIRSEGVSCSECHAFLRAERPGQKHARPDHVMFGTNQAVAVTRVRDVPDSEGLGQLQKLFDEVWFPGQVETVGWYLDAARNLGGVGTNLISRDLHKDLMFRQSVLGIRLEAPGWKPGGKLEVLVVTRNLGPVHPIPSGPLDLNDVWLEVVLRDEEGVVVGSSGWMDERHRVDPAARRLGAVPVDASGLPIEHHRFWKAAGLEQQRILKSDESTEDRLVFDLPREVTGAIRVRARWLYRRYNQQFADWVFDGDGRTLPVSVFGQAELVVSRS